jgi:hypothetical protein
VPLSRDIETRLLSSALRELQSSLLHFHLDFDLTFSEVYPLWLLRNGYHQLLRLLRELRQGGRHRDRLVGTMLSVRALRASGAVFIPEHLLI